MVVMASQLEPEHATKELKAVRERETELKRLNGELSCRECRRTKSGCDRKVPCTTCIDRNCPDICPLGTILVPNYEKPAPSRAMVSKKPKLDRRLDKLQAMYKRINVLEDALQLQTEGVHPLLADALVRVKCCDVTQEEEPERHGSSEDPGLLIETFGTLSIGHNAMHYIGPSSAELTIREKRYTRRVLQQGVDIFESALPGDLVQASSFFPFIPVCFAKPSTYAKLLSYLPSYARATGLIEAYFTNLSWYASCVEREQVRDDLLPKFYPALRPLDRSLFREEQLHDLGLLFVLLATGAVADLTQHFLNEEAEDLERLAKCALGLRSILEHGSLEACQAMVQLGWYESLTDRKKNEQSSASLITCGLKIGLSIGLHLDPGRWNLESHIVQRRRWVFWQLNSLDKMRSSESCYPPIFKAEAIDCKWPEDRLTLQDKSGRVVNSIWRWRHCFTRDSLTPLAELLSEAKPIPYIRILELGARLQAHEHHPFAFMMPPNQSAAVCSFETYKEDEFHSFLHPAVSVWWKQLAIQRLHRGCFARAIIENPTNPYESIFAPSFLATFHCTRIMLKLAIQSYKPSDLILRRLHNIWSHVAACGVIVGTIACHVKVQACRDEAHELLEQLITLFECSSDHMVPAENLCILKDLLKRSKEAYEADSAPKPQSAQLDRKIPSIVQVYRDADDELSMLSGHDARIIIHEQSVDSVLIPSLDYGSHLVPTQIPLPTLLSCTSSQSTPSVTRESPQGIADNSRDNSNSPFGTGADIFAWLSDHERDEADISTLCTMLQRHHDAGHDNLKEAEIDASPGPLLHDPTYLDIGFKDWYKEQDINGGGLFSSVLKTNTCLSQGALAEDGHRMQQPEAQAEGSYTSYSFPPHSFDALGFEDPDDIFNRMIRELGT